MINRTTHAGALPVYHAYNHLRLVAAAFLVHLAAAAAPAQAPNPLSQEALRLIDAPGIRDFVFPRDSLLREECEAALAAMRDFTYPSDADFEAVDARIHELGVCLLAAHESLVARRLNIEWGMELVSRRGRPLDAFKAFNRAEQQSGIAICEADVARIAAGRADALRLLSRYAESMSAYDRANLVFERLRHADGLAHVARGRGHVFLSLSCFEEALAEYETGARLLEGSGDELGAARCIADHGTVLLALSRRSEGFADLDRAAQVIERFGDERYLARLALNRGRMLMSQSRYDETLEALEQAERVYERLGNQALLGAVFQFRGLLYAAQSRHGLALAEYDKALQALQSSGDQQRLADVRQNRANALGSLSRYDEALSDLNRAAQIVKRQQDERRLAGIAHSRGNLFLYLSRFTDALVEYERGANIAERYNDRTRLGQILVSRGAALVPLGRYEELLSDSPRAARLLETAGDSGALGRLYTNQGVAFARLSRFEEALASFDKASQLLSKFGNGDQLAEVGVNRGGVLYSLSRYEESFVEYDKARQVFERLGNHRQLALIALNCAEIFRVTDRDELALSELSTAAQLYENLRDEIGVASVTMHRGIVFRSLARYDEALREFDAASKVYEQIGDDDELATIAGNRAIIFRALSRHDDALCELEKAQKVRETLGQDVELAGIAHIRGYVFQALGRHADALAEFAGAAARVETVLHSQVQILGSETSSAFREQFCDIVERALRSAASIPHQTDAQRNAAYKVYGTFVGLGTAEFIAERGAPDLDLDPLQERRLQEAAQEARQLMVRRDRIAHARRGSVSVARGALDDELRSVVEQLQRVERETASVIDEARLRQHVYAGIQRPKAASVEEVQSELDPDVALLEYALDNGHIFAFVTTRSTQRLVGLGGVADVLEDVGHVRASMTQDDLPLPDVLWLRRLGQRLLDPLLAELVDDRAVKTLLIAANGDLARIPFEVLLVAGPKANAGSSAEAMLLKRYDVAYVHSGTVMRAMRWDARQRTPGKSPEFVGFGFPADADAESDPVGRQPVLAAARRFERQPLPNSAIEVLEIARLFARDEPSLTAITQSLAEFDDGNVEKGPWHVSGDHFALFLRGGATEKALKKDPTVRTARVLHLACHGEADLDTPMLSRLVLARSGDIESTCEEDGYVYVHELRDLRISAELLVLSACSTNAGGHHRIISRGSSCRRRIGDLDVLAGRRSRSSGTHERFLSPLAGQPRDADLRIMCGKTQSDRAWRSDQDVVGVCAVGREDEMIGCRRV